MSFHQHFISAIRDPEAAVPASAVHPVTGQHGDAWARFAVYRNSYLYSLRAAMCDGFPMMLALLGHPRFELLATAYIEAEPASSPVLRVLGGSFAAFVEQFEPLQDLPYASTVARLDWAMRQAYHARDHEALPVTVLDDKPDHALAAMRLRLAPCVQLIASPWSPYELWDFLSNDAPPPQFGADDSQAALVFRQDDSVRLAPLAAAQAELVAGILQQQTLGQAMLVDGLTQTALQQTLSQLFHFALVEDISL